MTWERSRCRSCGAEILWARSRGGKRVPLDADPTMRGNVVLTDDGEAIVLNQADADQHRRHGGTLYLAHFATCPEAAQHRRREDRSHAHD